MDRLRKQMLSPLLALMLLALAGCAGPRQQQLGEPGEIATVQGAVRSVDSSALAVDGPAQVELDSDDYGRIVVHIAACEGPCVREAVSNLSEMRTGQRWRATGEVRQDGDLLIYDQGLHELTPLSRD